MGGLRAIALLLLALLAGCASQRSQLFAANLPAALRDKAGEAALPAPELLLRQRGTAAYSSDERWHHGSQWDGLLPSARVTPSGLLCVFTPGGEAVVGGLAGCAWCIYSFSLPAYLDAPTLQLDWDDEPEPLPGTPQNLTPQPGYWIALANFETQRWDFFPAQADGMLNIPQEPGALNLAPYHDAASELILAAIIVRSPGVSRLQRIQLGGPGWVHTWAGEFYEDYRWDAFRDMTLDPEGSIILSGHAEDLVHPNTGCSLLKYSAQGELLLQGVYTGGYYGNKHALAPDGSIYLGCSNAFDGYSRLAKVHPNGWLEWQRAYQIDGFSECRLLDMELSPDGYIYQSIRLDGSGLGWSGGLLLKYALDGELVWARTIAASDTGENDSGFPESLASAADALYVGGYPSICKLDGQGSLLWQREIDEAGYDIRIRLADSDTLQLASISGNGLMACELDTAGTLGPALLVEGLGQFPELCCMAQGPSGLSLLIESGVRNAALINLELGQSPGFQSAWRVSSNLFPGACTYDEGGSLYIAGGFHLPSGLAHSFIPLALEAEALTLHAEDPGVLVEDAQGSEVDYPGDFIWVIGLEDDLRPGVVSDNPGVVLKHEF